MLGSHKKGRRGAMRKLLSLVSSPEKHNLCGYPTQLSLSVLLLFLRTKAISSRMTLQENGGGGVLAKHTATSPLPTHTGSESLGLGLSYAVLGTSLRKSDFPLHSAETKKEPSRNDVEEGECLEGLAFSSQRLA